MMTTLNNRVSALFADPLRNIFRKFNRDFASNGESNAASVQKPAPMLLWETSHPSVTKVERRRTIHKRVSSWTWKPVLAAALIAVILGSTARADSSTAAGDATKAGPVVRTYGIEGGYRTEVKNETNGTLTQEDRRQVAILTAQIFQHIDQAQRAIDADRTEEARTEVGKGRQAIKAVRALLPTTTVHTKTSAPDGTVIYEDKRDLQVGRVPLFEGMLSTKTLAPIIAAKQDAQEAVEIKGLRLVGAETITTEAFADIEYVEGQLDRASKALEANNGEAASRALELSQVRGVEFKYHKDDTPLAAARDALWLTKRALDENNSIQARENLNLARQQLEIYRQIQPESQRQEVTQMMNEVAELDAKLRKEPIASASAATNQANKTERTSQGSAVTRWWDQVNSWFKK